MRRLSVCFLALLAVASLPLRPSAVVACPLCQGASRTLADELAASDAAVFARRVGLAPVEVEAALPDDPQPVAKTRFEIVEILKGEADLAGASTIDVLYFGEAAPETIFLLQATKLPELGWGAPFPLSEVGVAYVKQLPALPAAGAERLAFFIEHFEHADQLLARDAYDEFAKAAYAEIKAVTDQLPREQLVAWIKNPETVTSHRRLYLMLLGLCARDNPQIEEIAMLEEAIAATGEAPQPALDATIACYLTLTKGEGMPLVEERFLKNKEAVYSDTYSAIMALRFHGQDEQIIPRERVLEALKHLLDRPELADLIVADLARWQDWTAIDRLVELFKNADEKSSWVRVPVVQYLRACPLPEAEERIAELAKIDPKAVQRASLFVPLGGGRPAGTASGQDGGGDAAAATGGGSAPVPPPAAEGDSSAAPGETGAAVTPQSDDNAAGEAASDSSAAADAPQGSRLVVAVPLALGLSLLALLAFNIRK